jgi:hypothetical protein
MDRMATGNYEEGPIHNGVVQRDKLFACQSRILMGFSNASLYLCQSSDV